MKPRHWATDFLDFREVSSENPFPLKIIPTVHGLVGNLGNLAWEKVDESVIIS